MTAFYEQKWFKDALPYAAGAVAAAGAIGAVGASQGWFDSSTPIATATGNQGVNPGLGQYGPGDGSTNWLSGVTGGGSSNGTGSGGGLFSGIGDTARSAAGWVGRNPEVLLGAGLAAATLLGGSGGEEQQDPAKAVAASRDAELARWNAIPYDRYEDEPRYNKPTTRGLYDTRARGGERRYFAEGGEIGAAAGQRHPNGYLSGPGDGMSDEIPAMAHGEDGSRDVDVADGEYVIAADVVSGLGNGSTDAGVRFLDDLQARVRAARTGGEQPRPINPRDMLGR